ncbi:Uncharacterised protein [Mycobacteroides abscessus subsp. abscessus]|nr:Uncharacterised protein [Mycobacteroides abscessus subsp. abscessus]
MSASRRPTLRTPWLPRTRSSISLPMQGRPRSSDMVDSMPKGLLRARYTRSVFMITRAPSTRTTLTAGSIRLPCSVTISPSTSTRPS